MTAAGNTNNLKNRAIGRNLGYQTQTNFMNAKVLILFCAIVMGMGDVTLSRAEDENSIATITDVTLVRPGCFLATMIGSAFFVLALPFAAASHSVRKTADTLVVTPAQATFTRPVGDFSTLY